MKARIASFVKERNEALFSLDRERIEAYFSKRGVETPKEDIVFWAAIYKCICHITSAPPELVEQAKTWLHEHGMSEEIYLPSMQYS